MRAESKRDDRKAIKVGRACRERGMEVEDEIGKMNRKLAGPGKKAGVYSNYDGKLQESFKQGSYMI